MTSVVRNGDRRPLISVIVPVFNTEQRFLEPCLSSLRGFDDFLEVVVVDDGSELACSERIKRSVEQLALPHKFIRRENGGQNAARNTGVDAATGEYLMFLDSDDYLDREGLGQVIETLSELQPQMLGFGYRKVSEDGKVLKRCSPFPGGPRVVDKHECLRSNVTLCFFAFRVDLFEDGYRLVEGAKVGEDLASVVPLIIRSESFLGCGAQVYSYVQRSGSVTHTYDSAIAFDIVHAFDALLSNISERELCEYHVEMEWLCILHVLYFGAKRAINSGLSRTDLKKLRAFTTAKFPNWRENPILFDEIQKRNKGFKLLIDGKYGVYLVLHRGKNFVSHMTLRKGARGKTL